MLPSTAYKLGKQPPLRYYADVKIKAANYALPTVPQTWAWGRNVPFGMFLNDTYGDCTCAAYGHMEEIHSWRTGFPEIARDECIFELYHQTGVEQHLTDQDGRYMEGVLSYLKRVGLRQSGDDPNNPPDTYETIGGYAAVNTLDKAEVRTVGYLFGGVYTGVALPLTALDQINAGHKWSYVSGSSRNAPGSWGGHCMTIIAVNSTGPVFATWARRQQATWAWFSHYADEAYAVVTDDWTPPAGAPSGFNRAQLVADLAQL